MDTSDSNMDLQQFKTHTESENEAEEQCCKSISKNTVKATRSAVNLFKEYLAEKNLPTNFENFSDVQLAEVLSHFYSEVRTRDGRLYKVTSVENLRHSLNRYLKSPPFCKQFDLKKSDVFSDANKSYEMVIRELKLAGFGEREYYPEILESDRRKLYTSAHLSPLTSQGLFNKVQFDLRLFFCPRKKAEILHTMDKNAFVVKKDKYTGLRYVIKEEDTLKFRKFQGSIEDLKNFVRFMPEEPGSIYCPVDSFERYVSKINPLCKRLLQRPLKTLNSNLPVWYDKPVGKNTAGNFLPFLSQKCGLSMVYANRSICTTGANILRKKNFLVTQVMSVPRDSSSIVPQTKPEAVGSNKLIRQSPKHPHHTRIAIKSGNSSTTSHTMDKVVLVFGVNHTTNKIENEEKEYQPHVIENDDQEVIEDENNPDTGEPPWHVDGDADINQETVDPGHVSAPDATGSGSSDWGQIQIVSTTSLVAQGDEGNQEMISTPNSREAEDIEKSLRAKINKKEVDATPIRNTDNIENANGVEDFMENKKGANGLKHNHDNWTESSRTALVFGDVGAKETHHMDMPPMMPTSENQNGAAVKKDPCSKEKKKSIRTCIVCGKLERCKFRVVQKGDPRYLCDEGCFKVFTKNPPHFFNLKHDKTTTEPILQSPASILEKNVTGKVNEDSQKGVKNCQTCIVCLEKNISSGKSFLQWHSLEFCSGECLSKYILALNGNGSNDNNSVNQAASSNAEQYSEDRPHTQQQPRGLDFLNDSKEQQKHCSCCLKDISGNVSSFVAPAGKGEIFKDFCSLECLQKYEEFCAFVKSKNELATCVMCQKFGLVQQEILVKDEIKKFCSVLCLSKFQLANKPTVCPCSSCSLQMNESFKIQSIQFEGETKGFCSSLCVENFKQRSKKIVPCTWCNVKKVNFDMIGRMDSNNNFNKYQLFCSLNCLSLYHTSLQAIPNQSESVLCDHCHKYVPAQYHLTMSDSSVHHLCSYKCVVTHQAKFISKSGPIPVCCARASSQNTTSLTTSASQSTPVVTQSLNSDPFSSITELSSASAISTASLEAAKPSEELDQEAQPPKITQFYRVVCQPPKPKSIKNQSLQCKPVTVTQATLCKPNTQSRSVQTDESLLDPSHISQAVTFPLSKDIAPDPVNQESEEVTTEVTPATNEIGEDMLHVALGIATEMTQEPQSKDLEASIEPVPVNTDSPIPPTSGEFKVDDKSTILPSKTRGPGCPPKRLLPDANNSSGSRPSKLARVQPAREETLTPPAPEPEAQEEAPDDNSQFKYTYGISAWNNWVIRKNAQLEKASKTGPGRLKLFKTDMLACTADELNIALCLFVKEVRKSNGEVHSPDSIYYLCLGIQKFLSRNQRNDNIFADFKYKMFTEFLDGTLMHYNTTINTSGQLMCLIEEEHLWECKQLGAHSPHVLLNTMVYFNTKYFKLHTAQDHLMFAFTNISKNSKKTTPTKLKNNADDSNHMNKEEVFIFKQAKNLDNPLRCPVKLFQFYMSKCPESVKNRSDVFYLTPERSCLPDSPLWYSTMSLPIDAIRKMLHRLLLVREIQEAMHDQPAQS